MGGLGGAALGFAGLGAPGDGESLGGSGVEGFPDGVSAGGSRIVAVAAAVFDTDKQMMFTDDGGLTWTAAVRAGTQNIRAVAYSAFQELWVAIGDNGECQTSPDGETWTLRTTVDSTSDWRGIAYDIAQDLWCAVGSSGTNRVMTSPTALSGSWTSRASADDAEQWLSHGYDTDGEKLYAGVGFDVNRAMDSDDGGLTWTLGNAIGNGSCTGIAISPDAGRVVFISDAAGDIVWTDDAGTLYEHNLSAFTGGLKRAIAVNTVGDLWFASDATDGHVGGDGESDWVANGDGEGAGIFTVIFDDFSGFFVGLGSSVDGFRSDDGTSWTDDITLPTGADGVLWNAMAVRPDADFDP